MILVPGWPAPPTVRALTTTRVGGESSGPYASFNLATHVGDDPRQVAENRAALCARLGLPAEPTWLTQVHGTGVVDAGALPGADGAPVADASVTDRPGPVCAVLTADCLPVLFCTRDGSRVGAAHAGWRGLSAGVLEATLAALGHPPAEVLAWLGPGIGPRAYEVGEVVRGAFLAPDPGTADAFTPSGRPGHWLADMYALARRRLARAGVEEVHGGGLCTYEDGERFYSYRRDGVTGRIATLVWIGTEMGTFCFSHHRQRPLEARVPEPRGRYALDGKSRMSPFRP